MTACMCPKCGKKLFEGEGNAAIALPCKKCKEIINFNLVKEPDCLRVTAFIENNNLNEKTVSNRPVSLHA